MRRFCPEIHTERTLLRKYSDADRERFSQLMLDDRIRQYMGGDQVESEEDALALFQKVQNLYNDPTSERHFEIWAIVLDNLVIGHFELKQTAYTQSDELEVVYFIDVPFWGRGLMTEILKVVNAYSFNLGRQLIATIDPENKRTVKTLEKVGIERTGIIDLDGEHIHKVWISPPV